ncbi:MAG: multicopper oxidase domain-containing protein, partial [Acinetobacter baumannii]|nr:multicopper oxidase domain-containing protein [Acinetobacter baumannii]
MSHKTISSLVAVFGLLVSPWTLAAIKEYHLNINEQQVNVTGKPLKRITVNGKFIAPLLEFEEGDEAVIHVHNQLKNQDTSLHWHGLLLPGLMDGVPGFNNFKGIAPNGDFVYRFKVKQNGTYWYHAHSKGQEQDGLYGPLVIYPKGKIPVAAHEKTDRDYVVMLSDFHDSSSDSIMKNLKKSAEYYQNRRETVSDVWKQVKAQGLKATWQDRSMWNQMRMLKTDMSDVTGYTFLVNGKTPQQNWTANFKAGDKVRLRFINASAMSFFDVRI